MTKWYHLEKESLLHILESDIDTELTQAEAEQRLAKHGHNEHVERDVTSPWRILWAQLTATMAVILIIAVIISAFLGDYKAATAILVIVVRNTVLGFSQEHRVEKAMAALKKLAVPTVKVRRDGQVREISARDLLPGDIVLLDAGLAVPADSRLVDGAHSQASSRENPWFRHRYRFRQNRHLDRHSNDRYHSGCARRSTTHRNLVG
jgi:Ca2+-transporting ATPase